MTQWLKNSFALSLLAVACLPACATKGKSTPAGVTSAPTITGVPRNVVLTWTANREKAVNTTGGGYKVYYSQSAGFSIPGGNAIDVPYSSGASAPTTTTVRLSPGVYYFRVAAYSAMKPLSSGSTQLTVTIP